MFRKLGSKFHLATELCSIKEKVLLIIINGEISLMKLNFSYTKFTPLPKGRLLARSEYEWIF